MKKFILPFLIAVLGLSISACGGGTPTTSSEEATSTTSEVKTLESISLSGNYKTEYYLDDVYDKRGIVVTAHYTDQTSETVYDWTASGFRSDEIGEYTITITYLDKTATYTVTVSEEVVVTTDVTLRLTVSGVSEYAGIAEKIYLNSTLIDPQWGTKVLEQDSENPNLWTVTIEDVEVGQSYNYNFYYGNAEEPNWALGKNVLEEGTGEYRALLVSEDIEEEAVSYELEATFVVPSLVDVTVDLVLDPVVKLTADSEGTGIDDGVYVWSWIEGLGNVKLNKGEDNKWHYSVTVGVDTETGLGSLHYTAVLGSETAPDWNYQMGAWEAGSWAKWSAGYTISDITAETVSTTGPATFNAQPEVVDPSDAYNVTFKVTVDDSFQTESFGMGLRIGEWAGSDSSWVDSLSLEDGVYTYTYSSSDAANNYSFSGWSANGVTGDFYVAMDSDWHAWNITVSDKNVTAVVEITVDTAQVLANNLLIGNVTNYSGCVIA